MFSVTNKNKNLCSRDQDSKAIVFPDIRPGLNVVGLVTRVGSGALVCTTIDGKADGVAEFKASNLALGVGEESVTLEFPAPGESPESAPITAKRTPVKSKHSTSKAAPVPSLASVGTNPIGVTSHVANNFATIESPCVHARVSASDLIQAIESMSAEKGFIDIIVPIQVMPTIKQEALDSILEMLPDKAEVLQSIEALMSSQVRRRFCITEVRDDVRVYEFIDYENRTGKGIAICQVFDDDTAEDIAERIQASMQESVRSLMFVSATKLYVQPIQSQSSVAMVAARETRSGRQTLYNFNTKIIRLLRGIGMMRKPRNPDEDQPF